MTVTTSRAALAALLLASSALAAHAQDVPPGTTDSTGTRFERKAAPAKPASTALSNAVGKPLQEVQKDLLAKKFPDALTAAKAAQAAATTDYEKMKVNQFLTNVDMDLGDSAGATAAAEAAADTPPDSIPDAEKMQVYHNAAALALNAKHYDKAAAYAKQLMALNANDASNQEIIGKALYASGDPAGIEYFQKEVDTATAAGKVPSHDAVTMLLNAQVKAKNEAGAEKTLESSLLWFSDKNDWTQMVDITMSTPGIRDIDAVMLGRLLFLTGNVNKDDAELVGQTAQKLALYGDAQAAQAKGAVLTLDAARVAGDKNTMPQQIAAGATQNGTYNVKLAEALYGYGMYAEAETAARLAMTKGGIDASEGQMVIGMSQVGEGKYADAVTTFGQVSGGSPATPRIARLWGIYAKTKASPPAPAATAAAK